MCRPDSFPRKSSRHLATVRLLEKQIFGSLFENGGEEKDRSSTIPTTSTTASKRTARTNRHNKRTKTRSQPKKHRPQIIVQHCYHEHAHDLPPTNIDAEELRKRCSTSSTFPIKLQEMLNRVELDGFSEVVSWQPHGRCFVIHKPQEFKKLLPRYFKLSKIASFQRQLNLYGFQRLTQGLDKGGYYNEFFLRGKTFLAYQIQRVKVKGTGVRSKSNPEQEPDLWAMEWVGKNTETVATAAATAMSLFPSMALSSAPATTTVTPESVSKIRTAPSLPPSKRPVIKEEENKKSSCNTPITDVFDEELLLPPLPPLNTPTTSRQVSASSLEEPQEDPQDDKRKQEEESMILTEWGKPFYELKFDSLSAAMDSVPSNKNNVGVPLFTEEQNIGALMDRQQMPMDSVLDQMMNDLVHQKKDQEDLDSWLDQVVSSRPSSSSSWPSMITSSSCGDGQQLQEQPTCRFVVRL